MTVMDGAERLPARQISGGLLMGIIFLPFIFAWFLLQPGYGVLRRALGFGWMVVMIALMGPLFLSGPAGASNAGSGAGTTILLLIAAGGIIVFVVRHQMNQDALRRNQEQEFVAAHQGWDVYISPYNRGVIGLNRDGAEIVLGIVSASKRYPLSDVASVEVLKDGASITSTNRGSQLVGAAVGDLLLGPAGLLLGGLSGSKRTRSTIHSVAMKVIVDDRAAPFHVIEFFKSPDKNGTDAKSPRITPSLARADHFHALMVTALRRVTWSIGQSATAALPPANTADLLGKLWELRQAGALTDEEFASQKGQLIGRAEARDA
jgi:hypothetical protein